MSIQCGNPTVHRAKHFVPATDVEMLRKATKGIGTDEHALINILCHRSNEQRQIIQLSYKTHFGMDLIDDIRSDTSGNFQKLLVALLTPVSEFLARELHNAIAGLGTDEDVLIELLCPSSNRQIQSMKEAYKRIYKTDLESELISDTSGHFKRLLVSLCNAHRDESDNIDHSLAVRDAESLLKAGTARIGTDESTFNMIFCQRNFFQIKYISEYYHQMAGHRLEEAIEKEFSGCIKDGLKAILQCAIGRNEFFASCLYKSMKGLGTNDNQLIRVIVSRSEIDLEDIKVAFEHLYGKSLRCWIKGDTSGYYKHALYALIGEERAV